MAERFDWKTSDDPRDLIHWAVQRLVEGNLVAFPAPGGYAVAALATNPPAIARLLELKPSKRTNAAPLAIGKSTDLRALAPTLSTIGRRLVERSWPGPVIIVFSDAVADGLPPEARSVVSSQQGVGLWIPDHPTAYETLRLLPAPMILTRLKAADGAPILDPDHVLGAAGDQLGIVFDDGLLAESMPPTVIQVSGNEFRVLREGALPAARLRRLTAEVITFVCTGNSCRSPMAEVLFKRMLAERLECDQNALPDRGFLVTSAGLSAALGGRASTNAQVVVRDFGASLEDHESQQLNDDLAFLSDRLVVMTAAHREQILELWPELDSRVSLLGGNEDIADPVGFPVESYRQCAAQIQRGLDRLIETVLGRKK